MGNGGGDSCRNCAYNVAVQEMGPFPLGTASSEKSTDEWRSLSRCSLRSVDISYPFSTFCANFRWVGQESESEEALGLIYAEGYTEELWTYPRIPWHGENEVFKVSNDRSSAELKCFVCGRESDKWLLVMDSEGAHVFCCNAHYVNWWRKVHSGEPLAYNYKELRDPGTV